MSLPIPKPAPNAIAHGFHRMTMEDYLADPCPVPALSSSIVQTLLTHSPRHAWFKHPRLNPNFQQEERSDFDIGTCAHALLLEKTDDKLEVIDPRDHIGPRGGVPKGWTNDSIRAARDEARAARKIPLLVDQAAAVREMVGVAEKYIAGSELAGIFKDGEAERTMIWQEGPTWFKARPDWLTSDQSILLHYKTTATNAEPDRFGNRMLGLMGYDVALMFYERGLYQMPIKGERPAPRSVILAQETEPPYECSLVGLDPERADLASRKVELAVSLWARCMKSGNWPAYPKRVCYIGVKPWEVADVEVKESWLTSEELEGGIPA